MANKIIIIRGVSGAGKTTFVGKLRTGLFFIYSWKTLVTMQDTYQK
jgi:signal recognition particle GTPase